jgi:CO/xanthine dehydrogenase FAD-binding subunit
MSAYYRPETLDEACAFLHSSHASTKLLAGGTDYYPAQIGRLSRDIRHPERILDLSAVAALRGIADRGDHWWIGATTTWSDIIAADLPPLFDALKSAAREIGGIQIQNRGTIGGNLCTASPAGDAIPCLLALDADVECIEGTTFRVPMGSFYAGYRTTVLDGGIVTGVRIPKQSGRSVFRKLGTRRYLVISIAMISLVIETDAAGVVHVAKAAVGACSAVAQRLPLLEAAMMGQPLTMAAVRPEHLATLTPIDDIRASADYRRHAAVTLLQDAIAGLVRMEAAHE